MDTTTTRASEPSPIACSLEERELMRRGEGLRRELFGAADETRELEDGYAFLPERRR